MSVVPETFEMKAAKWLAAEDEWAESIKASDAATRKSRQLRMKLEQAKEALMGCVGSNIPEKAATIEGRGVVVVHHSRDEVRLIPTS